MHILVPVLHRPQKPTGVCRHAVNLAQCLAQREEVSRITLVIGTWQQAYFTRSFNLSSSKIHLAQIDLKNRSLSRNAWYMLGLPKLARELQPDLVHLSFPFPFVRQWFSVPVVATIHDLYPFECPDNFGYPQVWFNQLFLRQCIAGSDGLSCVSKTTLKTLELYFPHVTWNTPTEVVYNSVDFRTITATQPNQIFIGNGQPYIMSVAQHRKNKNLDLLIRAYAKLLQNHKIPADTLLILVGSSGPETGNLGELIQSLNLEEQVALLSALEDSELRWLYENAALFVIPSSTEGFCLPLIEAQSLGCPAICSDIPIFREIAGPNCAYFDLTVTPVDNLADKIVEVLNRSEPIQPFINPSFLQKTVAQAYLNFYNSVAASL